MDFNDEDFAVLYAEWAETAIWTKDFEKQKDFKKEKSDWEIPENIDTPY